MARPFIEFIQSQWLDWVPSEADGRPAWHEKVLTVDSDTGATTKLVWLPPSWLVPTSCHLAAGEEFVVLSGGFRVNGIAYGHLGYGFLPAGHTRRHWWTGSGAIVMSFSHATAELRSGDGDDSAPAGDPLGNGQIHIDPYTTEWREIDYRPKMAPGARKLALRTDPDTGEATWLLGAAPVRSGRFPERHPVTEETFVIDGWSIGPRGSMGPGAYFCRPPEEWHGPFGTPASGKLNIVRSLGGPLSTDYDDSNAQGDFEWDPTYDPILPPEMAAVAARFGTNTPSADRFQPR